MSDLISRQAAINAVHKEFDDCIVWDESGMTTANEVEKILDSVPSAQPERKKSKWISTDDGWDGEYFVCSVCGCPWTLIEGSPEDNGMNFCPNCGADMRGEQNGQ